LPETKLYGEYGLPPRDAVGFQTPVDHRTGYQHLAYLVTSALLVWIIEWLSLKFSLDDMHRVIHELL
jgi:hypothetical protein